MSKLTKHNLREIIRESVETVLSGVDEAVYPQSFNIERFRSCRSFNARQVYCNSTLERLGSGSSRIVYKIDDNTVLKLAKNQKGVAQNLREISVGTENYYQSSGLFAEVYDYDENGLWLEMQYARPALQKDWKRIYGFGFQLIVDYIEYITEGYSRHKSFFLSSEMREFFNSEKFEEMYEDYDMPFMGLHEFLGNEQIQAFRDFQRKSTWGVVKDSDGSERIVIIDYGIDDDVWKNYYSRH